MAESKVTYPKGSAHPSKSVGECETTSWPEHIDDRYPHGGAKETSYHGDRSQTLHCSGNNSSAPGNDYKKKRRKFETEKYEASK